MKAKTISGYIDGFPQPVRTRLREMHSLVIAAAPGATQSLKWSKPAYSYRRILVVFGAFKHHIGFFITPAVKRAFAKELAGFKTATSSVQLPFDQPLPKALIRKIVAHRVREERSKDAKWRTRP